MPLLTRAKAATAIAIVVMAGSVSLGTPAVGAPQQGEGCISPGPMLRYVVVFDKGTSRSDANAQIDASCGSATVYYPEIAVGIATSPDPSFLDRIGTDRAFSAEREQRAHERDPSSTRRTGDSGADGTADDTGNAELPKTDPSKVPTEDRGAEQWDMTMIGAEQAHKITRGSRDVVVGVLDSGVDAVHPDLAPAVDPERSAGCLTGEPDTRPSAWAPTTSAHGTHVAGTIAAADDGKGTTGVAPDTRLASVKVVDDDGRINPEAAVCGLMWAAENDMDVANSSFFVDPWLFTCEHRARHAVVYEAVSRAIEYANSQGTLNVAAATNEAVNLSSRTTDEPGDLATAPSKDCRVLPAGLRDVVAVSSIGSDQVKAGYSSYGLGVIDVAAPGGERRARPPRGGDGCVLSTVPGGYDTYCGTSMAAPHVSGVAALLAAKHPDDGPQQLRDLLRDRARPLDCPADYDLNGSGLQDAYCSGYVGYNGFYGHGVVDALAATR